MKVTNLLGAAALALVSTEAISATTVYSSQGSFQTNAGATTTENFADAVLVPGLTIISSTGSIGGGLFNDRLAPGDDTIFSFSSGQSAFGGIFDLSPGGSGLGLSFTLGLLGGGTEMLTQELANSCTSCFFGFTSTNPFVSVSLNSGNQGGVAETYNLNDLQFAAAAPVGAVPEPSTWALMLLGFGFIGAAVRSSKRRQKGTASYA